MVRVLLMTVERDLAEAAREVARAQGLSLTVLSEAPSPEGPTPFYDVVIIDPRPYPGTPFSFDMGTRIMLQRSSPIQAGRVLFVGSWEKNVGRMNSFVCGGSGYLRIHPPGGPAHYQLHDTLANGIGDVLAMPLYEPIDFHDAFPNREFYRQVFESMQVPVLILTTDGMIKLMNLRALACFDYPTHMVINRSWKMLIADDEPDLRSLEVLKQINMWYYYECSLRFRDRSGRTFPALMTSSRVYPGVEESYPHIVLTITDITETEELQRQINILQRMESVERVVAGMTHEFNNLLTAIMGHAELLVEDLPARSEVSASARVIRRESERARQLTQRLLGLSRHRQFLPVPLSCNQLVRELVTLMKPSMGERITLTSRLTDENDTVRGDMGLLQQVLVNLCLNARDAIAGQGQITIDTSVRELTGAECRYHLGRSPGMYVEICVRDTGAGMTPEIVDRVFEPFFTTKEAGAGSGLGLSVVHGIVRNHGGHVDIESTPGKGTNVYVLLPQIEAAPVAVAAEDVQVPASEELKGTEGILLVDDERNIVMYGQRVLSRLGYRVYPATSAELAREAFARHRDELALIILDLSMPETSGSELLAEFRRSDTTIPIVVATGFAPGGLDDDLVEQVQGFIKKPFTPRDLLEQVREVIDGARGS